MEKSFNDMASEVATALTVTLVLMVLANLVIVLAGRSARR